MLLTILIGCSLTVSLLLLHGMSQVSLLLLLGLNLVCGLFNPRHNFSFFFLCRLFEIEVAIKLLCPIIYISGIQTHFSSLV